MIFKQGLTRNIFVLHLILMMLNACLLRSEEIDASWLKVPEGFKVTHYADDDLATNIYCMTSDPKGRIVVAGPGYIKTLIDEDQDGKADRAQLFSSLPKNGAMGLCFDGTDLLCVGDQGLIRFQDKNQDGVADGPPEVLLRFKTGGEHDSHAIRKGPDGWWYLISGNYSGVGIEMISSNQSPVKKPVAGVITRISPDFQKRQIFADGMRNAYDFDFNEQGDLFVYDSDGERDVSLPWYRPTRVYRLHPGSHAGWVTRSWKRPHHYFDMPTVAAKLGRGSPTGVVCYRHWQFPKSYRNSIFVLDWTFGRVVSVSQKSDKGTRQEFTHELFVSGKGTHGFAPTDACVGLDGSLFISVGGRSTRGSVYRVRHIANAKSEPPIEAPKSLVDCLDVAQPLDAWSRTQTSPIVEKMGQQKLEECITNESLSVRQRVRAVELLTEHFGTPTKELLDKLSGIKNANVQARLAWSVCQSPISKIDPPLLFHFLNHPADSVRVAAMETLTGNQNIPSFLAEPVLKCLQSENRHLQKAAAAFTGSAWFNAVDYLEGEQAPTKNQLPVAYWMGRQIKRPALNLDAIQIALKLLGTKNESPKQLDALRLFQISLGDVGPVQGLPQVFESYRAGNVLPEDLKPKVAKILNTLLSSENVDVLTETVRCIAMCKVANGPIANKLLGLITTKSSPQSDIHVLASLAHGGVIPPDSRELVIRSILGVQDKIDRLNLNQDRNWEPRFKEIVRSLFQKDDMLAIELAKQGIQSRNQVFLIQFINSDQKIDVIDRLIKTLQSSEDFQLDSDLARLLASTSHSPHWEIIRKSAAAPNIRDTVVELLARKPYEGDRPIFVLGLESPQVKTVRIAAQSLLKLEASRKPDEQFALVTAMARISPDKEGYAAREWIVRVLQRNMGRTYGFVYGTNGYSAQPEVAAKWIKFLTTEFPEAAKKHKSSSRFDLAQFSKTLFDVDWKSGNLERGEKLYTTLSCAKCHGKRNRLGPDLAGVTKRFSREDLFRAIVDPSYQVPSRYQTTLFETYEGKMHSGIIIYDSVDGVLLRDSDNKTVRIEKENIERRQKVSRSLMPEDLLKELDAQGYADLYEYLKSL